jgi:hypothetical protein
VRKHEITDKCRTSWHNTGGTVREEVKVGHYLTDLVVCPLFQDHVSSTERDKSFCKADTLVAVQYLPDKQLSVSFLVSSLLLVKGNFSVVFFALASRTEEFIFL